MRNTQHIKKNGYHTNKLELPNYQVTIPNSKASNGSVVNKYPVILDGGRTIIYISDKKREPEIRLRYSSREH